MSNLFDDYVEIISLKAHVDQYLILPMNAKYIFKKVAEE